jgi:hypothetical protein
MILSYSILDWVNSYVYSKYVIVDVLKLGFLLRKYLIQEFKIENGTLIVALLESDSVRAILLNGVPTFKPYQSRSPDIVVGPSRILWTMLAIVYVTVISVSSQSTLDPTNM